MLRINLSKAIGISLALITAYNLWNMDGFWFTLGMLMANDAIAPVVLTIRRRGEDQ